MGYSHNHTNWVLDPDVDMSDLDSLDFVKEVITPEIALALINISDRLCALNVRDDFDCKHPMLQALIDDCYEADDAIFARMKHHSRVIY